MDKDKLFLSYLADRKINLLKAIEKAKDARDNAPSATESHSDTRRSQAEKLVVALEIELNNIQKVEDNPQDIKLVYFEMTINSNLNKFLLVPSGMGGAELNGIRFLSEDTPLGSELKSKNTGDEFDFNGQKVAILKVE
ncbi:MAG: hypothetical protein WA152_04285 [Microgenomates group bacterium]